MNDRPEEGKVYALTSDGSTPSIASGNTWAESEVRDGVDEYHEGLAAREAAGTEPGYESYREVDGETVGPADEPTSAPVSTTNGLHVHEYQGQTLRHAHPNGHIEHDYFGHDEDPQNEAGRGDIERTHVETIERKLREAFETYAAEVAASWDHESGEASRAGSGHTLALHVGGVLGMLQIAQAQRG